MTALRQLVTQVAAVVTSAWADAAAAGRDGATVIAGLNRLRQAALRRAAQEIAAEIGPDMGVFPTAARLGSCAKFAPVDHNSVGRNKGGGAGKGSPWPAKTLEEVVGGLPRTDTFLGERHRRLARRRGKKRAIVATGNSVLAAVRHILNDSNAHFVDRGSDYYDLRLNRRRRERDLVRRLERLTGRAWLPRAATAPFSS
ncbi:hypothetical protein ACIBF1_19000 [Spirillospora sp. NPDC050679]